MELFPATDDDQWTLIKRVIDECDYYLLILGGRYGSIGPQGVSYTEQEYMYAIETGKPVIAFLHKNPGTIPMGKSESNPNSLPELSRFRETVQKKTCKYWETPTELGSIVSRSLVRLIKTHPMPGWIRADQAAESIAATEVLRLKKNIEELQAKLNSARSSAPIGAQTLAQGEEEFPIELKFDVVTKDGKEWVYTRLARFTWNDIFEEVGPHLMSGVTNDQFKQLLLEMVKPWVEEQTESDVDVEYCRMSSLELASRDEQTIKIQLRALGLIERLERGTSSFWRLTAFGDSTLVNLLAIGKGEFKDDDDDDDCENDGVQAKEGSGKSDNDAP
jgi:hypothetical protein